MVWRGQRTEKVSQHFEFRHRRLESGFCFGAQQLLGGLSDLSIDGVPTPNAGAHASKATISFTGKDERWVVLPHAVPATELGQSADFSFAAGETHPPR